jgi:Leucine-rich repeat (LRR) protein
MKIPIFSWLFLVPMSILFLNFSVFVVAGQCMGNQQYLLLELKNNLTFNPAKSKKLVNWNQSVDCCSWEGVTCNEGRVIGLDLTSESISGELTNLSSLFGLQDLQNLSLAYNDFNSSRIPSEFGRLANLSYLNLRLCNLIGSIPDSIVGLTQLVSFDMSYNHLNGSIPSSISGLTQLVYLDMSLNSFSGTIPSSMAGLTQLIHLDLSANYFSGPIPIFSECKNLTEVSLCVNSLSGEITSTQWEELLNLEILCLSFNSLNGNIPVSLFSLPSLQNLDLSHNQFSGQLKEFSKVSSHILKQLYLDNNQLEGPIPMSIFEFQGLEELSLSSNKFNGSLDLISVIQKFKSLSQLCLSYNDLTVEYNDFNLSLPSFPLFSKLELASCKLKKIPDFLRNQSNLFFLDLSHNQIYGEIPNWIWKHDHLRFLNLSYNYFLTLEGPVLNVSLEALDLRSNQLQGQLPIISSSYLDFSRNNFHSVLPAIFGQSLASTSFLSLSGNKFYGSIPKTLCNATKLEFLDLSNNSFSGTIPQCLIEIGTLEVLSLRQNNLNGTIPDAFQDICLLRTLALNKNQLEGVLPKSLAKCALFEVLDIGNNHIEDTFPFYLKNALLLKVLVLRSNNFYGPIAHLELNASWPLLQILDVASNNFTGNLPLVHLSLWMEMVDPAHEAHSELGFLQLYIQGFYYQDTITITSKGSEVELVKILTIFNTLDFSCNNFYGSIPGEIGEIALLYILNLSHNALTGQIPTSLGKLSNLESLDLSNNELTGKIPMQLANGLIFLSVLNLSFNQLVGQIPFIKQFATFSEASFKGNRRLCGLPLKSQCSHEQPRLPPPTYEESHKSMIEWNYISAELGFVFGFGIVIGPIMFWKRWRIWYYKHVDDILFKIFPQLYFDKEHRRRQPFKNQGLRH